MTGIDLQPVRGNSRPSWLATAIAVALALALGIATGYGVRGERALSPTPSSAATQPASAPQPSLDAAYVDLVFRGWIPSSIAGVTAEVGRPGQFDREFAAAMDDELSNDRQKTAAILAVACGTAGWETDAWTSAWTETWQLDAYYIPGCSPESLVDAYAAELEARYAWYGTTSERMEVAGKQVAFMTGLMGWTYLSWSFWYATPGRLSVLTGPVEPPPASGPADLRAKVLAAAKAVLAELPPTPSAAR